MFNPLQPTAVLFIVKRGRIRLYPIARRPQRHHRRARLVLSSFDWWRPRIRRTTRLVHAILLVLLFIAGLGPMLWLAKAAIAPTQDTPRDPLALWPNVFDFGNLAMAWPRVQIDKYFLNTVVLAAGPWLVQLIVATTAGFALSCCGLATAK
ncbi:hypothetical protein [Kibdelosporangium aridum]|uniref:hypothetical protein n=1 Tax=Kibdelosporangium aridum TaxID=2030 RepID=UPI0035EE751B